MQLFILVVCHPTQFYMRLNHPIKVIFRDKYWVEPINICIYLSIKQVSDSHLLGPTPSDIYLLTNKSKK